MKRLFHYIGNSGEKKGRFCFILLFFLLFAFFCTGCVSSEGLSGFSRSIRRWEKDAGGTWNEVFSATETGVVGGGYLRTTVHNGHTTLALERVYDYRSGMYWELEEKKGNGAERSCRMWPLEELLWRIHAKGRKERIRTRRELAGLSPFVRNNRWRFFSGGQRLLKVVSTDERRFGYRAKEVIFAAFPGTVWRIFACPDFPLTRLQSLRLLTSCGLTEIQSKRLYEQVDGAPVDIEILDVGGRWRERYTMNNVPTEAAPESVLTVFPADAVSQIIEREEVLQSENLLLKYIDSDRPYARSVTKLGMCVRYCRRWNERRRTSVYKRLWTLDDPLARSYLMTCLLKRTEGAACGSIRALVEDASIEHARDAAEALSEYLPKQEAVRCVQKVLARGWAAGLGEEHFLWATDLLRDLTGKDLGYWPGEGNIAMVNEWMRYGK